MAEAELVRRVVQSTDLTQAEAQRVITDVLAYYDESVTDYIRRRHAHLQTLGVRNDKIFARIAEELPTRPFQATPLSTRQIRRIIYG